MVRADGIENENTERGKEDISRHQRQIVTTETRIEAARNLRDKNINLPGS